MMNTNKLKHNTHSITQKYIMAYAALTVITVGILLVSILTTIILTNQYQRTLGDLLGLNMLFSDVEKANQSLYDSYMYQSPAGGETYREDRTKAEKSMHTVLKAVEKDYSREVIDLCCIIDTYLQRADSLIVELDDFRSDESIGSKEHLVTMYGESQDLMAFINQNFQQVYMEKLMQTQQMQSRLDHTTMVLCMTQIGMLGLALFVGVYIYYRVVHDLSRPVKNLIDFASGVTKDIALQEHIHIGTGDELELFADAFNEMLDTIHRQMDQIAQDARIREQLQKAEVENLRISAQLQYSKLRLLQSRINPHFMFNTLNMITQTAHMEEAEETAHLMEATADFLRYSLGKVSSSVTLADEIENTKNYAYIQNRRFGRRIEISFSVDESCTYREIPCMILQPLVENAVSHGVGSMISGGKVLVSLFPLGEKICLEVQDNGVGISQKTQDYILSSFHSDQEDSHIGLRNVYQRLNLFFGTDFDLQIESRPGTTVVRMLLPA